VVVLAVVNKPAVFHILGLPETLNWLVPDLALSGSDPDRWDLVLEWSYHHFVPFSSPLSNNYCE